MFHVVTAQLGRCHALTERVAEAIARQEGGLTQAYSRALPTHPRDLLYLSETYLLADRLDDATSTAERALHLCRTSHHRVIEPEALRIRGDIHARHAPSQSEQAERSYRQALALADELGMRPSVAHRHVGLGKLYKHCGKHEQAWTHVATFIAMYREMGMRFWLKQAEAELGGRVT
jgi:hypothetical protein